MIATLVGTERRTWKSWGNFNNLIGAPLCLDNMPDDAEVVISEMGMNHRGEIATLAGLTAACGLGFKLSDHETPAGRPVQDAVVQLGPGLTELIAQTETAVESAVLSYRTW